MAYLKARNYAPPAPTNLDMASPEWAAYQQAVRGSQADDASVYAENARRRDSGVTKWLPRLATGVIGAATGASVLPALFGGGAAAATTSAAGAPVVSGAGGTTLGSILNSDALGLGVGAAMNYFGNRSQNQANRYATDVNARNTAETLALERQRLEQEATNANLDREDARKLNEAINELKRRELDAAEEDRAYNRSLIEARELRAAPRREMSARAMRSLGSILGL